MPQDLRDFWHRFQSGVDVGVAGNLPDKLLGVRDAFLRYFHERYARAGPIRVIPHPQDEAAVALPLEDSEILEQARERAHGLLEAHPDSHAFYVGTETGLFSIELGRDRRHLVRTWSVVLGLGDEAWGSSGSVQLPERLIHGLDEDRIPFAVPGTRRSGGMVSSLTGGLESRRTSTALATFNALSTLSYGLLNDRRQSRDKSAVPFRGGLYSRR